MGCGGMGLEEEVWGGGAWERDKLGWAGIFRHNGSTVGEADLSECCMHPRENSW